MSVILLKPSPHSPQLTVPNPRIRSSSTACLFPCGSPFVPGRPLLIPGTPPPEKTGCLWGRPGEYFYSTFSVFPNKAAALFSPKPFHFLDPGTTTSGLLLLVLQAQVSWLDGSSHRHGRSRGTTQHLLHVEFLTAEIRRAGKDRGGVLAWVLWQREESESGTETWNCQSSRPP